MQTQAQTGWIIGLRRHRAGRPHVHPGHRRRAGSASGFARRHALSDIAAWRSDDVHNVSQALGISRDISRQNWIEQAALLERRKAKSEIETAAPAREHVSDLRPELQEIVEAARKDAPAHDDAPSPLALELASQTLGERADATVAAGLPRVEERVAPLQSASGAEPRVDQRDAANADKPALALKFAPQHGAPIPVVAVSAPANTDAAERARRLADAQAASGSER